MTILMTFKINNEIYNLFIKDREIYYQDRKVGNKAIRVIPTDPRLALKIKLSRNKLPPWLIQQFTLTKEEEIEYNSAKTEEELALICKKDCIKNGSLLIKESKVNE